MNKGIKKIVFSFLDYVNRKYMENEARNQIIYSKWRKIIKVYHTYKRIEGYTLVCNHKN